MNNVTLNVSRDRAFVGSAMSFRIIVDNNELGKIRIGEKKSFEVQNQRSVLKISMVGNALNFHKIKKEVVLFPKEDTQEINCMINSKINWFGALTLGILQAVGRLELTVEYK